MELVRDDEHAMSRTATVEFVELASVKRAAGSSWRLTRCDDPHGDLSISGDEAVEIHATEWTIEPASPDWRLARPQPRYELAPGRTHLIWVARVADLTVDVVDEGGTPLPAARVWWSNNQQQGPLHFRFGERTTMEGVETAPGTFTVAGVAGTGGQLVATCGGYAPRRQTLLPGSDHARVHLARAVWNANVVRVTRGEASVPVNEAVWSTGLGVSVRLQGDDGRFDLPGWMLEEGPLRCKAPGCVEAKLSAVLFGSLEEVRLGSESILEVHVRPSVAESDGLLVCLWEVRAPGWLTGVPELVREARVDERGVASFSVPRGSVVRAVGFGRSGETGESGMTTVDGDRTTVHLDLAPAGRSLQLEIVDSTGSSIPGVRVETHRRPDGRSVRVVTDPGDDGSFVIPRPDDLVGLSAFAPGHVPTVLERRFPEIPADGHLAVELDASHSCTIRVQDARGQAVAGMGVALWSARDELEFAADRSLGGAARTSHGAWVRLVPPPVIGSTGADGTCRLAGVSGGECRVVCSPDNARNPAGFGGALYPQRDFRITVPASEPVTCTVALPRSVALSGFDSTTGLALSELCVRSPSAPHVSKRVAGNAWAGLVSDADEHLVVSAGGYDAATVDLAPHDGSPIRREVFLEPRDAEHVVLTGDLDGLVGKTVTYEVLRPIGDGSAAPDTGLRYSVRARTVVAPPGLLRIHVPTEHGAVLRFLDVEGEAGTWRFAPSTLPCDPSSGMILSVDLVGGG